MYIFETKNQDNLEERIENQYDVWLEFAKNQEIEKLAAKVRAERDRLLEETDKEMCLDRIGIDIPEDITATNLLSVVKSMFGTIRHCVSGDMAKYRQALRDITKQARFSI